MKRQDRVKVSQDTIAATLTTLRSELNRRLESKGRFSYASSHEALGIITEEYYELIEAVKSNKLNDIRAELLDVAVGCIFAVASLNQPRD